MLGVITTHMTNTTNTTTTTHQAQANRCLSMAGALINEATTKVNHWVAYSKTKKFGCHDYTKDERKQHTKACHDLMDARSLLQVATGYVERANAGTLTDKDIKGLDKKFMKEARALRKEIAAA